MLVNQRAYIRTGLISLSCRVAAWSCCYEAFAYEYECATVSIDCDLRAARHFIELVQYVHKNSSAGFRPGWL